MQQSSVWMSMEDEFKDTEVDIRQGNMARDYIFFFTCLDESDCDGGPAT